MIELSDEAKQQLDAYFADKPVTPIRIYVANGCGGEKLGLALDEAGENDSVHTVGAYTFVVAKDIEKSATFMKIGCSCCGFDVSSDLPLSSGGGCCSSCSSCG